MSWPTQEQFDKAAENGHEYALTEYTNGAREPREAPLSGEWADDPTSRHVASDVGYVPDDNFAESAEAIEELANAWERGYSDAWTHSLPTT